MSGKIVANKSKKYLLPLLSEFLFFDKSVIDKLENTYIFTDNKQYENCISLLFSYDLRNPVFTKFENNIFKNELFIDHYDLKDNKVLYILKFPKEYFYEYKMFQQGKYSEFGKDAQNLICDFLIDQGVSESFINNIMNVFIKNKHLRTEIERKLNVVLSNDSELDGIMNEEKETINIKEYINNIYE